MLQNRASQRRRSFEALTEAQQTKRRMLTALTNAQKERANMLETLDSIKPREGEGDWVIEQIPRGKINTVNALQVSSEALKSLQKTIREEEERKEKEEEEEREKQKKQSEIQALMSNGMMRSGAEELKGKAWNARALFERILWSVCLRNEGIGNMEMK